jgi:phospholipid/cholesterol/gamma-HCH transport system substrate-binding protein
MSKERGLEFKVGLLLVVALGLLVGFVVVLGNFSVGEGYHLSVDYSYSGNLQPGAPVKVSGIKVGKVNEVRFLGGQLDPKTNRRVQVRMILWLEKRAQSAIHDDAEFFINTQGVLGEQYIEVVPGSAEKPLLRPDAVVRGVDPPRVNLIVARLYEFLDSITKLLRDEKVLKDLLQAGAGALTTIDKVLLENRQSIGKLLVDVDRLTLEAVELVGSVKKGVGDGAQLQRTLANVEHLVGSLSREIDPILAKTQKTLDGVTALTSTLGPEERKKVVQILDAVLKIGDSARRTTGEMEKLVASLRQGQGTAGALLVQDDVYQDLREMVRDLKRRPWRLFWKE